MPMMPDQNALIQATSGAPPSPQQAPQGPGMVGAPPGSQPNNPSMAGGINNMIAALIQGNKQHQASQGAQNTAGGYNPDGSMSGHQWAQAGQGQGPYAAMGAPPGGAPSGAGAPPMAGSPPMPQPAPFGAGSQPTPYPNAPFSGGSPMMSALMTQPPPNIGGDWNQ